MKFKVEYVHIDKESMNHEQHPGVFDLHSRQEIIVEADNADAAVKKLNDELDDNGVNRHMNDRIVAVYLEE